MRKKMLASASNKGMDSDPVEIVQSTSKTADAAAGPDNLNRHKDSFPYYGDPARQPLLRRKR